VQGVRQGPAVRSAGAVRRLAALLGASLAVAAPVPARADEVPAQGAELHWNERWPRFRVAEYAAAAVLGPFALIEYYAVPFQQNAHWTAHNAFDDGARSAFRLRDPYARRAIREASDAVDTTLVVLAVGLDSVVVPVVRGSWDVAWQTGMMDIEAFSLSSIVAITGYDFIGRGRPLYDDCQRDPSFDESCPVSPTASFPSGHVNEAFTAAGLSCANHTFLPIYGSRLADAFACARDVTLATVGGMMRMMGDRHWAIDVLAGAGIGFGFGYGIPTLLHYAVPWRSALPGLTVAPMPPGRVGLVAAGQF
jgi:hypothetical protein